MDNDRLAALNEIKLRALIAGNFGVDADALEPVSFTGGAGVQHDGAAYLYLHDATTSALGATLAWSSSRGLRVQHLFVDDDGGVVARQAAGLDPRPSVWRAEGTTLVEAQPAPHPDRPAPGTAVQNFRAALVEAGTEVLEQDGQLVAEVNGLEVARVVPDDAGGATLRVGVGALDQDANAMISGVGVLDRLPEVVATVRAARQPGAAPERLSRLARERWLRRMIQLEPALVGADPTAELAVQPDLEPRGGLQQTHPVALRGRTDDGASLLVVCSVGIDLDLVPVAADHLAAAPADRVVLAVPARDAHPVIERMADHLVSPTEVRGLTHPWPD